ncbi:ATP/maltotriose-dependent transcriptional regulator MalT [Pseudomonas laurylsulfativorans]|uniref:LuxR C-terminal-related transcriptional regulator n=1 Tax=Pseudomonas laurylsulfativorans TaxID=1943631 RepID=UPI00209DF98E|nr:LuxR C-terminal-related transcriptional regulator [Pseudomonas laurylsulfativorans]MCP1419117.1 ATP/maltotriose-dependent transcriptional regulator MalT [Pseudomonas laurylsulfativorans]
MTCPITCDTLTALHLYERNETDAAHHLLTGVWSTARHAGCVDALIISHLLMARLALQRGERQGWLGYLLELERLGQQRGSLRIQASVWLEQTRIETLGNRLEMAQLALHTAEHFDDLDRPGIALLLNDIDSPLIARQRLRIAQGHFGEAIEALLPAITRAQAHRHRRLELKLLLLLAMAHDGNRSPRVALQTLGKALRLASAEQWRQCFIEEGERLLGLLRRWFALEQKHPERDFVADLLQRIGPPVSATGPLPPLTAREVRVLQLLAVGHRNRVIAEKMFLSECTVKTHLYRINRKLGAGDRNQALAIARRQGWLD